jgi:hypothetical protein
MEFNRNRNIKIQDICNIRINNIDSFIETETIIIGHLINGNIEIHINQNFSCTPECILIDINNNVNFNLKYIYYNLKLRNFKLLLNNTRGINNIIRILERFLITQIELEHQNEIVNLLDEYFIQYNINENDYNFFMNLLINKEYSKFYKIIENEKIYLDIDDIIYGDNSIIKNNQLYFNIETIKLNEIMDFKNGTTNLYTIIFDINQVYINYDDNTRCFLYGKIKDNYIEQFNLKFIYYCLKFNYKHLCKIKRDKHILENFKIANINLNHQLEIVNLLDEYFNIFNIDFFIQDDNNYNIFKFLLNREYERFYYIINERKIFLSSFYILDPWYLNYIENKNMFKLNYYIYKLHDWIDINKINFKKLSGNRNAIKILERNRHKIDWSVLSGNINAIELLEENKDKIDWGVLSGNINAIKLLEENKDKIDWGVLSGNKNAIKLLEKNQDKIDWGILSRNKHAKKILKTKLETYKHENSNYRVFLFHLCKNIKKIEILEEHQDKINWLVLSWNKYAIKLLEENQDKINWCALSGNINAIKLLQENQDKIHWQQLSGNINAISLLQENQDKIHWKELSGNINAIKLLQENQDKIDWDDLSENINIFAIDYNFLKERMLKTILEELMKNRFHPKNQNKWIDWGFL